MLSDSRATCARCPWIDVPELPRSLAPRRAVMHRREGWQQVDACRVTAVLHGVCAASRSTHARRTQQKARPRCGHAQRQHTVDVVPTSWTTSRCFRCHARRRAGICAPTKDEFCLHVEAALSQGRHRRVNAEQGGRPRCGARQGAHPLHAPSLSDERRRPVHLLEGSRARSACARLRCASRARTDGDAPWHALAPRP